MEHKDGQTHLCDRCQGPVGEDGWVGVKNEAFRIQGDYCYSCYDRLIKQRNNNSNNIITGPRNYSKKGEELISYNDSKGGNLPIINYDKQR